MRPRRYDTQEGRDYVARRAARQYKWASRKLDATRKSALPVGREVSWEHGGYVRWGRVVDYAFGRVKVERVCTGVQYWVDCWRIREISP